MPQAIGAAIVALATSAGISVGVATVASQLIVSGLLIGAQLLLAPKPDVPKPADGKFSLTAKRLTKQGLRPCFGPSPWLRRVPRPA